MTRILSIDPGKNTGIALGSYSDESPYELLQRWQVHGGVEGFKAWWAGSPSYDVLVVEKFVLSGENDFAADLTPKEIEGALCMALTPLEWHHVVWQPRTDKARLIGYPKTADTKAKRQRVRFNFLKKHGLFAPGTENDDSNDAITHALVHLKVIMHRPTLMTYWPPRRSLDLIGQSSGQAA